MLNILTAQFAVSKDTLATKFAWFDAAPQKRCALSPG